MKSRYSGLRTIGTLALILAWVVLILGIVVGVATWLGLNAVQSMLNGFDLSVRLGPLPILGVLPGLLWGILGFLVYYAIGKTLHLLVDVDERTIQLSAAAAQPAAAEDAGEVSGEMKRQAKLIAANLEATQDIQRQLATIETKMGFTPSTAIAAGAVVAAADSAADAASDASADASEAAADAKAAAADATEATDAAS